MTRGKPGPLPVTMVRTLIKAKSRVDEINTVRVGETMEFLVDLSSPHGGQPTGWLDADGRWYWRGEWPELAPICRSYTHWFRWHVLRQFRVPDFTSKTMMATDWGGHSG